MKIKITILVIVGMALVNAAYTERTVWYVHPDSALSSIQAGLDSCADNDIVLVGPGTYYENIVWPNTQGIHLTSELGPAVTAIDGNSGNIVIRMTFIIDTTTMIIGFTIRNGFALRENGAGFSMSGGASPLIRGNIISYNHAEDGAGGGIYCSQGAPVIAENTVTNNYAVWGGGIYCDNASSATITHNNISYNNLGTGFWFSGGGICCYQCSALIDSNIISHNIAPGSMQTCGGGIACFVESGFSVTICHNTIDSNTAVSAGICYGGGGVAIDGIDNGGRAKIYDNIIIGNGGDWCGNGCGIYCCADSVVVRDNLITGNISDVGGGISMKHNGNIHVVKNSVVGNTATEQWPYGGGGISCSFGVNAMIESCYVANNIGSGIHCNDCYATPLIHYCNITDNIGYALSNAESSLIINAEDNWWGDSTGPFHPDSNPGGLGDTVSDYVDFIPWLYWPGVQEYRSADMQAEDHIISMATIHRGSRISFTLAKPCDMALQIFDIAGRQCWQEDSREYTAGAHMIDVTGMASGIYFVRCSTHEKIETQKVLLIK